MTLTITLQGFPLLSSLFLSRSSEVNPLRFDLSISQLSGLSEEVSAPIVNVTTSFITLSIQIPRYLKEAGDKIAALSETEASFQNTYVALERTEDALRQNAIIYFVCYVGCK